MVNESNMDSLDARMIALAKLTSTTDYDQSRPKPSHLTDSWRSLLPPHDPKHPAHESAQRQQDNDAGRWGQLVDGSVESDKTQDIFLGPNDVLGAAQDAAYYDDGDFDVSPVFGRRADLFVRRSQLAMHSFSDERHKRRISADPTLVSTSPPPVANDGWNARNRRKHVTNTFFDLYEPSRSRCSSEVEHGSESMDLGNDRESWPTSSRQSSCYAGFEQAPLNYSPVVYSSSLPNFMDRSQSDGLVSPSSMYKTSQKTNSTFSLPLSDQDPLCIETMSSSPLPSDFPLTRNLTCDGHHTAISTTPESYSVIMHMPGFSLDGITLTMKGSHRRTLLVLANKWGSDRWEHFERRIVFSPDALMSRIRARFENEQLIVQVPRKLLCTGPNDVYIHTPSLSGVSASSASGSSSGSALAMPADLRRSHNVRSAQF